MRRIGIATALAVLMTAHSLPVEGKLQQVKGKIARLHVNDLGKPSNRFDVVLVVSGTPFRFQVANDSRPRVGGLLALLLDALREDDILQIDFDGAVIQGVRTHRSDAKEENNGDCSSSPAVWTQACFLKTSRGCEAGTTQCRLDANCQVKCDPCSGEPVDCPEKPERVLSSTP